MKHVNLTLAVGLCLPFHSASAQDYKTNKEKASYVFGYEMAGRMGQMNIEVDMEAFIKGVRDQLDKKKMLFSKQERSAILDTFRTAQQERAHQRSLVSADEGKKFLLANGKKPGVVKLPTGLQYKVLKEGDGAKPAALDKVKVHYEGKLVDGTEFDSSYRRGEPITFPVSRVIPGWTQALKLMQVGSKWQLFIPPHLGYGKSGSRNTIPPNAVLIFQVELLGIEGK